MVLQRCYLRKLLLRINRGGAWAATLHAVTIEGCYPAELAEPNDAVA